MKSEIKMSTGAMTACIVIVMISSGMMSATAQRQQDRDADQEAMEQRGQSQWQQPGQLPGSNSDVQQPVMRRDTAPRRQVLVRASKFLKMKVQGQDGERLGDVEEMILSQDRRSVEHVKVSLGDGWSVNLTLDELIAKPDDDGVLLVRVAMQELQQRRTRDRGRDRVGREQDEQASRRVSGLIGMDVQGKDGEDVGSINDLIIDRQNGRITIAAMETGGSLGLGKSLSSVEWRQVNFAADGDTASIDMTKDQLAERSHSQSEYWDSHAVEGGEGQRERVRQQTGTRQQTPGMEQRGEQDAQPGRERTPGVDRETDPRAGW